MAEPSVILNNPEQAGAMREQDLIARVQRGQTELFYELVRPYERRVYAAALAILRNPADAEDVAQEAVVKALANIRQFRAESRFSTWLIQITVNEALMRRRRRKIVMEAWKATRPPRRGTEYAPRQFADWREIPSETLERKEVRQRLAEALATLDRKYREVFVLRDMEQLNIQETAEALGISTASVKTRLLRARLMLRDLLAAGWEQGWFSRLPLRRETSHGEKRTRQLRAGVARDFERYRRRVDATRVGDGRAFPDLRALQARAGRHAQRDQGVFRRTMITNRRLKCPLVTAAVWKNGWRRTRRSSRSRWSSLSAWLVPVAALALIAGGLRLANWPTARGLPWRCNTPNRRTTFHPTWWSWFPRIPIASSSTWRDARSSTIKTKCAR